MARDFLNSLSRKALSAAMRGGTDEWGRHGSAVDDVRYSELVASTSRRRCFCGCKRRATHRGVANGVTLIEACELRIARWVRDGR